MLYTFNILFFLAFDFCRFFSHTDSISLTLSWCLWLRYSFLDWWFMDLNVNKYKFQGNKHVLKVASTPFHEHTNLQHFKTTYKTWFDCIGIWDVDTRRQVAAIYYIIIHFPVPSFLQFMASNLFFVYNIYVYMYNCLCMKEKMCHIYSSVWKSFSSDPQWARKKRD